MIRYSQSNIIIGGVYIHYAYNHEIQRKLLKINTIQKQAAYQIVG